MSRTTPLYSRPYLERDPTWLSRQLARLLAIRALRNFNRTFLRQTPPELRAWVHSQKIHRNDYGSGAGLVIMSRRVRVMVVHVTTCAQLANHMTARLIPVPQIPFPMSTRLAFTNLVRVHDSWQKKAKTLGAMASRRRTTRQQSSESNVAASQSSKFLGDRATESCPLGFAVASLFICDMQTLLAPPPIHVRLFTANSFLQAAMVPPTESSYNSTRRESSSGSKWVSPVSEIIGHKCPLGHALIYINVVRYSHALLVCQFWDRFVVDSGCRNGECILPLVHTPWEMHLVTHMCKPTLMCSSTRACVSGEYLVAHV